MSSDATLGPERVIGRYALFRPLASGGMATVHLGMLSGAVGFSRTVAIKRLHPHLASDPEFTALFLDEARLAARIRHPNVVPTLDVVAEDGELFLVMEYVEGASLAELAKRLAEQGGAVPARVASAIVAGMLHGLHAAHESLGDRGEPLGIVHRDVSPQNVLVGTDGVPRLIDFGVAKAVSRLQTTRDGQVKGKLAYMAPEQIRAGDVSRRTDVYASAVVLWEALVGRRLFGGDNDGMVVEQVLLGLVDPPSSLRPGVPETLDALLMRALDRDPERRFATAREMALELERAVPPALPLEVAEWLLETAGAALTARIDRVRSLESAPRGHSEARALLADVRARANAPRAHAPRRRFWLLAAPAVLLLSAAVVFASRSRSGGGPEPGASAAAVAEPLPSSPPSVAPPLPSAPATDAPAVSATSASTQVKRPAVRPKKDCDPPYTRDGSGRVIWKRECL